MKLLCRIIGHRWQIVSWTDSTTTEWCERCDEMRTEEDPDLLWNLF